MLVSRLTLLTTLVSVAFPLPDGPGRPERRGWPNWPDWRPNWPGWPNRDDEFDLVGYGRDNPLGRTTGGEGGCTTTVTSPEALAIAVGGDEPKIVYDNGKFALPERLKVGSNKTILGVGRRTLITENDISVVNATNVIIRNLKISRIRDNDALTIHSSTRVWIDHNEIESDMDHGPDYYVSVNGIT